VAGAWQVVRDRNEKRCERILEGADPMDGSDVDWGRVASYDLDADTIGCLVYMRDVEAFVDRELVGLPGHPNTVGDPLIRRFLDVWRAEEHGHATVLARFLDTYAADRGVAVPARQPTPLAEPSRMERALVHIGGPIADTVTASTWHGVRRTSS
jgi:hypothetical protein